jgi:hypothetical protein
VFEGLAAPPITAHRGITAGSAGATFELLAMMLPIILAVTAASPTADLCLHVDDFAVTAHGNTAREVATTMATAASILFTECTQEAGLHFGWSKAILIATDRSSVTPLHLPSVNTVVSLSLQLVVSVSIMPYTVANNLPSGKLGSRFANSNDSSKSLFFVPVFGRLVVELPLSAVPGKAVLPLFSTWRLAPLPYME